MLASLAWGVYKEGGNPKKKLQVAKKQICNCETLAIHQPYFSVKIGKLSSSKSYNTSKSKQQMTCSAWMSQFELSSLEVPGLACICGHVVLS